MTYHPGAREVADRQALAMRRDPVKWSCSYPGCGEPGESYDGVYHACQAHMPEIKALANGNPVGLLLEIRNNNPTPEWPRKYTGNEVRKWVETKRKEAQERMDHARQTLVDNPPISLPRPFKVGDQVKCCKHAGSGEIMSYHPERGQDITENNCADASFPYIGTVDDNGDMEVVRVKFDGLKSWWTRREYLRHADAPHSTRFKRPEEFEGEEQYSDYVRRTARIGMMAHSKNNGGYSGMGEENAIFEITDIDSKSTMIKARSTSAKATDTRTFGHFVSELILLGFPGDY